MKLSVSVPTTANAYACYLLSKKSVTPSESALALDLVRFCEDQFTYWGEFPGEFDARDSFYTPGVVEQYQWRAVVDASVAGVAQAFLYEYLDSGDKLWLAKAEALADLRARRLHLSEVQRLAHGADGHVGDNAVAVHGGLRPATVARHPDAPDVIRKFFDSNGGHFCTSFP